MAIKVRRARHVADGQSGATSLRAIRIGAVNQKNVVQRQLAGAQLHVNERVAVMLEMGWQMHRVYEDDASLTANQAKLQLGAMLLL